MSTLLWMVLSLWGVGHGSFDATHQRVSAETTAPQPPPPPPPSPGVIGFEVQKFLIAW